MVERECSRVLRVSDTLFETVYHVLPKHSNPIGTLHGGIILDWMITTATMAATRASKNPTVLARMEHTFFVNPIRIHENVIMTSWVDYAGKSSLDVTVVVESENPVDGTRRLTTVSYMTLVAVDGNLRPVPHGVCIEAHSPIEVELHRSAEERRRRRLTELSAKKNLIRNLSPPKSLDKKYYITSYRFVYPEDTVFHAAMFAGRLLYYLDELAGILGLRYSRGPVVTAAVDATDFLTPLWVGESVEMHAALTYVGRSSMEITLKVIARNEITGEARHTTTSYFTIVALDYDGRPRPVPQFKPVERWQMELYKTALERKKRREALLRELKARGAPPIPSREA